MTLEEWIETEASQLSLDIACHLRNTTNANDEEVNDTLRMIMISVRDWQQSRGHVVVVKSRNIGKTAQCKVDELARKEGWIKIENVRDPNMLSYTREGVRLNYWPSTGTVGTCMVHPKQGSTQLFRKKVFATELETIFKNPRVHTGKGYK